ncbi:MAG: glycosyltransferase [Muribaculaceae bacterium]|nr:glycosyltransferase [Muribaculaceae bacterium]
MTKCTDRETAISIIIPSFNQAEYLDEALLSVFNQDYTNYEVIVMDGGSTDGSVDVIRRYESRLAHWQSAPDGGQSEAINNGFRRAKGEFVTWLNSDDVMMPGTLRAIDRAAHRYPSTDFYLGNVVWIDSKGVIIRSGLIEGESAFWNKRFQFSNGGPSAFVRRSVFDEIGYLREDFGYAMDTEFWKRLIATGHPFRRIGRYCWAFRCHELSKTTGQNFAASPMADKNHPSWKKREREDQMILSLYPTPWLATQIWRLSKLISPTVITRITHKKYLGKHYSQIDQ